MHDIFVANSTCCYEAIPFEEKDNLFYTITHIICLGFCYERSKHPRSKPQIWVKVDKNGSAAYAIWATSQPS
jgi:hypothetical protein